MFNSPVAANAVQKLTDTGKVNKTTQESGKIDDSIGDVEDGKKDSVTNEVALSSSTIDPSKEVFETQAKEVNKTSNSTEAKDSHAKKAKSPNAADALKKSTSNIDKAKSPDAADMVKNQLTLVKIMRQMKRQEK